LKTRSKSLTILDVAKAAGVSTATVSNVLNKTGKVGKSKQRLVLSTVKLLGYVPDAHARRLASGAGKTLGIIVSDIENPFFPEVIKSFETRARQLGYEAILSDTNYDPRRTREAAERMKQAAMPGAIIVFSVSRVLLAFNKETTPIVALGIALIILLGASFVASRVSPT